MRQLGLEFYDANGKFVGLGETARRLQDALSGLSDEQKNLALITIFSADAQRQAIALMDEGAGGVEKYRKQVLESGNAAEQAKIQTEGWTGATNNLSSAFDSLGAAISKSRIFELLTELTNYAAGGVRNVAKGIDYVNKGQALEVLADPTAEDLARLGVKMQQRDGRTLFNGLQLDQAPARQYAVERLTPDEALAWLEEKATGTDKKRRETVAGKAMYDAIRKAAEDARVAGLPTVNTGDLPLPGAKGGGKNFGDEVGDVVIKKITDKLTASDVKLNIPDSFTNATELMKQNSEAFLRNAIAAEEALRPITDIVEDIKSELEYAIVRGDWSDIGDAFSEALRRVLYESVMQDLVNSFGDMLEQVFAMIFQRLSRSQSKGFDDFLGGVFDAVVGGVDSMIGGTDAALSGAKAVGAQALHVTVNAQDAVLTSTVKGWVAEGAAVAINHSRGIVPADQARKNMGRLS